MKKATLTFALLAVCEAAMPGSAPDPVVDRMAACANETDERRRLACFDREIAASKARTSEGPVATTPRVVVPASPASPPSPPLPRPPSPAVANVPSPAVAGPSLGEEQLKGKARMPGKDTPDLQARISELRRIDGSTTLVTLDNGQIWKHENLTLGAYLREGDTITIRKGSLGSYRLTRDEGDDKNWIRVMRMR